MDTFKDEAVLAFEGPAAWRDWLAAHHADHPAVWLRMYPKGSGRPSITYAEALDEALCYGWIDGQKNKDEAASFLQRFTRRKPRSAWSQRNREHVARLEAAGKMEAPGRREVDAAKADGRWDAAYAPQSAIAVPPELEAGLAADPVARAFFDGLTKAQRYSFLYRIETAKKPETRAKRVAWALELLSRGERAN